MQPGLVPNLWFDSNAEEAADFYVSTFPDSRINSVARYTDAAGEPGSVLLVDLTVNGTRLNAINGGPHFQLSEAVSLMIECDSQDEIDQYWDAITPTEARASAAGAGTASASAGRSSPPASTSSSPMAPTQTAPPAPCAPSSA